MWSIAITVTLGITIGIIIKWTDKMKQFNSNFQVVGLSILLFLMGVSIGSNPNIIKNLSIIGIKSIAFALITVFFSIISVFIATKIFRRFV